MKLSIRHLLLAILLVSGASAFAQSILPTPFTYPSCTFNAAPTGYQNCVGSPDCAASRCTVPAGCSGQAVMCFGESFTYVLPTALTTGQGYDISMNVSTGHLGLASIINGNHTFQVVGTVGLPPTCGTSSYGSICSTPGAQVLLTGTVNTIGWVPFSNTFVAGSAITHITITNCDGTGNGGNLFCSPQLTSTILAPVEVANFEGQFNDCQVDLAWETTDNSPAVSRFDIVRAADEGARRVIGTVEAHGATGMATYRFTDREPGQHGQYQLEMYDLNGHLSQSTVLEVDGECADNHLSLEANPVTMDQAYIYYYAGDMPRTLKVVDMTGRKMFETRLKGTAGASHKLSIDVSTWKAGIYFITTSDGELVKMNVMR